MCRVQQTSFIRPVITQAHGSSTNASASASLFRRFLRIKLCIQFYFEEMGLVHG